MSVRHSADPSPIRRLDPMERAALLVIDLQNDFCSPDGLVRRHDYVEDPAAIERAVEHTIALAAELRRAGVPCIFVRSFMDEKYKLPDLLRRHRALGIATQICQENTWGAGFYRVQPAESECTITKHTNDAFLYTFLEPLLRKLRADTLILSGVYTELCIEDTARSAIHRGFHVIVPEDCTAGLSTTCVKASLDTMRSFQMDVLTSSALSALASASAAGHEPRRPGSSVHPPLPVQEQAS